MPEFRFTVPSVPHPKLSPNSYVHWGQKARAKKKMKDDWMLAIAARRGDLGLWDEPVFSGTVACAITIWWPPGRSFWDNDNAVSAFKAGIDALQEKGIVANDKQIAAPSIAQEKDPEKKGYVEVVVTG